MFILNRECSHPNRGTRFAYIALAAVVLDRIPVADWDESDYRYVAALAKALESGNLALSELIWSPECGRGWTKNGAFAAKAVSVFMANQWQAANAAGDEDAQADVDNDNGYLMFLFRLYDPQNPFYDPHSPFLPFNPPPGDMCITASAHMHKSG